MNGQTTVTTAHSAARIRVLDYLELMKPELTGLSVLTALCGYYLAGTEFFVSGFVFTGLGTLLLGGGAGALNQYAERSWDALMKRTERRPLPSGRLQAWQAFLFGVTTSIVGLAILFFMLNMITGFLGIVTFILYVLVYTPLKRYTWYATLVGAVPGALPPVMGWTAAGGELGGTAAILFLILFFWQMPHFFSLAWMYRKDYGRAGYRMLTVLDLSGTRTSRQTLLHCVALIPASLALTFLNVTGTMYAAGALVLGCGFLALSVLFRHYTSMPFTQTSKVNSAARIVFFASLIYLPSLFFLMTVDKV
ncbi:MAG: protoheme IX farnesyltransferase [Ignavibacteriales bacterium]|nr:protoheme IX farnesyltransferase [Ignavibacteriales bacterium]